MIANKGVTLTSEEQQPVWRTATFYEVTITTATPLLVRLEHLRLSGWDKENNKKTTTTLRAAPALLNIKCCCKDRRRAPRQTKQAWGWLPRSRGERLHSAGGPRRSRGTRRHCPLLVENGTPCYSDNFFEWAQLIIMYLFIVCVYCVFIVSVSLFGFCKALCNFVLRKKVQTN